VLKEIKKELLKEPERIRQVLANFGYANIIIRNKYIQFGRSESSSPKSITIHLDDNEFLYVKDWARNEYKELISFICTQRSVEFSDVMRTIRSILGIEDYYDFFETNRGIFGGIYDKVRKYKKSTINTYDDSLLEDYENCGNLRFLRDNISLSAQKYFGICYDRRSQTIVIPIRDQLGQLVGIKARCNYDVLDGDQKYYYLLPCQMSQQLYGYSQNYKYMQGDTVLIFEAEKSPMQCFSYGIRYAIGLGSGSLSSKQAQMIMELNPRRVIFMHDVGYKYDNIERNIMVLKSYSRFSEMDVGYWDNFDKNYGNKISASDLGGEELKRILQEEIKYI